MSVSIPVYRLQLIRDANWRTVSKHIQGPQDVVGILATYFEYLDREHFVVLSLDTKGRATGMHTVAIGTLDQVAAHPREVFKYAVLMNAASLIAAHNHPSGDPTPSAEDRTLTRRLTQAGNILGIPLLDHVIFGDSGTFTSLSDHPVRTGSYAADFR